jgi:hypothetical protein
MTEDEVVRGALVYCCLPYTCVIAHALPPGRCHRMAHAPGSMAISARPSQRRNGCLRRKTATALRASQRRRGQKTAAALAAPSLRTTDWGRCRRGMAAKQPWQSSWTRARGRLRDAAVFPDPGSVETRGKVATTLTCLAMTEWEVVHCASVCHCTGRPEVRTADVQSVTPR